MHGVFVSTRTGINCTEIFIISLLIRDSCCTVVYVTESSLNVTTGITCRASKQFTLLDTREQRETGQKKMSKETSLFYFIFLLLTASEVNNGGRPTPGQRKREKNVRWCHRATRMTPPTAVNKVNKRLTAIYRSNSTQVQRNFCSGGGLVTSWPAASLPGVVRWLKKCAVVVSEPCFASVSQEYFPQWTFYTETNEVTRQLLSLTNSPATLLQSHSSQTNPFHGDFFKNRLTLSFHPQLRLPRGPFPSAFPAKTLFSSRIFHKDQF